MEDHRRKCHIGKAPKNCRVCNLNKGGRKSFKKNIKEEYKV